MNRQTNTSFILDQMARNTTLLPQEMSSAILSGDTPPLEDIVDALVVGAIDCDAMTQSDPTSDWNVKRMARACLIIAFLSALTWTIGDGQTVRNEFGSTVIPKHP